MNKEEIIARPYEEYYEMIKDMSKDNMIQGLYDLSKNCIEYQNYINQLEDKLNKINTILSNIDEKKIPKYQDKIRDIKFLLEYDFWANQKVECDRELTPEELEIHNILLEEIKKEGDSND